MTATRSNSRLRGIARVWFPFRTRCETNSPQSHPRAKVQRLIFRSLFIRIKLNLELICDP
jgi:hypothetical protein